MTNVTLAAMLGLWEIVLILIVVLFIPVAVAVVLFIVWLTGRKKKGSAPGQPPLISPATERLPGRCPQCGSPLKTGVPEGLCPACLLQHGIATEAGGPAGQPAFVPPSIAELTKLFPQLEIIGPIGKGGMGAVYKARQPALDRFVALKILAPRPGNELDFASRFSREARALARLSHPNIVAVYDFGVVSGGAPESPASGESGHRPDATTTRLSYFIMEFVDGPNLRQVQQAGRIAPREALEIIPQICAALQFAHDEGIVHRDIKPENVLLDRKGRVKIADFGLAKILGQEAQDFRLTGARDVMGTPHYMAPEQVEKPQEVDHRADIFSLGVVFYEMLTGELPLGKFQPPSAKVQVDVRLDEIILRALEKEPGRRYQHVSEVRTQVESVAGGPGASSAKVPDAAPSAAPLLSKPDHFWRRFAVVMACVILIPVVIAVVGLLAAIAIPNFVKGRRAAQELRAAELRAVEDWNRENALSNRTGLFENKPDPVGAPATLTFNNSTVELMEVSVTSGTNQISWYPNGVVMTNSPDESLTSRPGIPSVLRVPPRILPTRNLRQPSVGAGSEQSRTIQFVIRANGGIPSFEIEGQRVAAMPQPVFSRPGSHRTGEMLWALASDFPSNQMEVDLDIGLRVGPWLVDETIPGFQTGEPTGMRITCGGLKWNVIVSLLETNGWLRLTGSHPLYWSEGWDHQLALLSGSGTAYSYFTNESVLNHGAITRNEINEAYKNLALGDIADVRFRIRPVQRFRLRNISLYHGHFTTVTVTNMTHWHKRPDDFRVEALPLSASSSQPAGPASNGPAIDPVETDPSGEHRADDLNARFEVAKEILSFTEKDTAMAALARDAAAAGEVAVVRKALGQMTAFTKRDEATREAARRLAGNGQRTEALELARTITSFTVRDATLRELADQ